MAEFFIEYGLFLIKSITLVTAIIITVAAVVALSSKAKQRGGEGQIEVKCLNEEYDEYKEVLEEHILDRFALKQVHKERKEKEKEEEKAQEKRAKAMLTGSVQKAEGDEEPESSNGDVIEEKEAGTEEDKEKSEWKKRLFVLDFDGDIKASQAESLGKEITAILSVATSRDEVLIRIESPGGMVHGYGLAASQMDRIRKKNIPLTVAVDKVAASGGYMMACLADKIIAAPFAILGSIGVLAQLPNVHKLLKKHDIEYEVLTAGEFKRTLTVFGENTEKGREKFIEELEDTHVLFKDHVSEHRPVVEIDRVATGEHWYGKRALDLKLVDELKTSDEYLLEASANSDIYHVAYELKKPLIERLSHGAQGAIESTIEKLLVRFTGRNFY